MSYKFNPFELETLPIVFSVKAAESGSWFWAYVNLNTDTVYKRYGYKSRGTAYRGLEIAVRNALNNGELENGDNYNQLLCYRCVLQKLPIKHTIYCHDNKYGWSLLNTETKELWGNYGYNDRSGAWNAMKSIIESVFNVNFEMVNANG